MPLAPGSPKLAPKTLARQQVDFTAEGAPPPGKVSTGAPLTIEPAAKKGGRAVVRVRGTIKLKPPKLAQRA